MGCMEAGKGALYSERSPYLGRSALYQQLCHGDID